MKVVWMVRFEKLRLAAKRRRQELHAFIVSKNDWLEVAKWFHRPHDVIEPFVLLMFHGIKIFSSDLATDGEPLSLIRQKEKSSQS